LPTEYLLRTTKNDIAIHIFVDRDFDLLYEDIYRDIIYRGINKRRLR